MVVCLVLAVVAAVLGWVVAYQWYGRATRAEDEYRQVTGQLASSEGDVSQLQERQRELAAEKAGIEDDKTALAAQKQQLEADQRQLAATADVIQKIAVAYRDCSGGYAKVIGDLDSGTVSTQTQATLDQANAACDRANALVDQLRTQ
jgi:chromosome segregation ATPase